MKYRFDAENDDDAGAEFRRRSNAFFKWVEINISPEGIAAVEAARDSVSQLFSEYIARRIKAEDDAFKQALSKFTGLGTSPTFRKHDDESLIIVAKRLAAEGACVNEHADGKRELEIPTAAPGVFIYLPICEDK